MHQKNADLESMEFQESGFQEALGGWTEVELNAPKSSQPKVSMYQYVCTHSQFSILSLSTLDRSLCLYHVYTFICACMYMHGQYIFWCVCFIQLHVCTLYVCIPNKEEELYQEAEPVVSTGLSAALQMAVKKGFVDTEKKKKDPSKIVHVYSDEQRDRYVRTYTHVPGLGEKLLSGQLR